MAEFDWSSGASGYHAYGPGYDAAFPLDPEGNNVEALYRDVGSPEFRG